MTLLYADINFVFVRSLTFLRRKVKGQKEGQLSFLKANVGSVMDQIDTLKLLKEKFEEDKQKFGSDSVLKLEKAIKGNIIILSIFI